MSPEPIEVRRSRRRRRTVSAYREGGRPSAPIPAGFSASEEKHWVDTMLRKLEAGDRRRRPSDEQLAARAAELSLRYLGGLAKPTSIVWSMNQASRCGVLHPLRRLDPHLRAVKGMPSWVLDYVIMHELAHLLQPSHGRDFWALLEKLPTHRAGPGLPRGGGRLRGPSARPAKARGSRWPTTSRTSRCGRAPAEPPRSGGSTRGAGCGPPGSGRRRQPSARCRRAAATSRGRSAPAVAGSARTGHHRTSSDSSLTTAAATVGGTAANRRSRCSRHRPKDPTSACRSSSTGRERRRGRRCPTPRGPRASPPLHIRRRRARSGRRTGTTRRPCGAG